METGELVVRAHRVSGNQWQHANVRRTASALGTGDAFHLAHDVVVLQRLVHLQEGGRKMRGAAGLVVFLGACQLPWESTTRARQFAAGVARPLALPMTTPPQPGPQAEHGTCPPRAQRTASPALCETRPRRQASCHGSSSTGRRTGTGQPTPRTRSRRLALPSRMSSHTQSTWAAAPAPPLCAAVHGPRGTGGGYDPVPSGEHTRGSTPPSLPSHTHFPTIPAQKRILPSWRGSAAQHIVDRPPTTTITVRSLCH